MRHCLTEHGRRIESYAGVIMPTHAHLLFKPLENSEGEPFSLPEIMKGIKGSSAYNVNRLLGRKGTLWQPESFDRILRRGEFEKKLNYILANPIDAGLASRPDEYPWGWRQVSEPAAQHSNEPGQLLIAGKKWIQEDGMRSAVVQPMV